MELTARRGGRSWDQPWLQWGGAQPEMERGITPDSCPDTWEKVEVGSHSTSRAADPPRAAQLPMSLDPRSGKYTMLPAHPNRESRPPTVNTPGSLLSSPRRW